MKSRSAGEAGLGMIEVLVAIGIFAAASAVFYQVLVTQSRVTGTVRSVGRIGEEARNGFNRLTRDVREADEIEWINDSQTQFTIKVDYNEDGVFENPNAQGDNEVITYGYHAGRERIFLCDPLGGPSCNSSHSETLMSGVTQIDSDPIFSFSSDLLEYDWNGDGVTSWIELDAASDPVAHNVIGVGDDNGSLSSGEYPYLNVLSIAIRQTDGERSTDFRGTVQMRNQT